MAQLGKNGLLFNISCNQFFLMISSPLKPEKYTRVNISHVMRKHAFSICENKDADQHLCFRYIDSTIPLLPKSEISSLWPASVAVQPVCVGPGRPQKTGFLLTQLT